MSMKMRAISILLWFFCCGETASAADLNRIPMAGDPVPGLEILDEVMLRFMHLHDISTGALGVSQDGKVIFERTYGWMDRDKKIPVRPDVMMRVASCTKPLVAAAVRSLVNEGRLMLDTPVFQAGNPDSGILEHVPRPGKRVDDRLWKITVGHLLLHEGGWDRRRVFDLTYREREIANDLGVKSPPGRDRTVKWILEQPLQFEPGKDAVYSNVGYLLLGLIIEKVSGRSCRDYVYQEVMKPLGVADSDFIMGRTFAADQDVREPFYDEPDLLQSVFEDTKGDFSKVEAPYGSFDFEARTGQGRVVTTPGTLLRFMSSHIAQGAQIGERRPGRGNWRRMHDGSLKGSSAMMWQRGKDGVDFVVLFNKRARAGASSAAYHADMCLQIDSLIESGLLRGLGGQAEAGPNVK